MKHLFVELMMVCSLLRFSGSITQAAPFLKRGQYQDDAIYNVSGNMTQEDILNRAHSHNDYHQSQPLASALKHGVRSIEIDVFPRGDSLLVGHTQFELRKDKTMERLYTEPILILLKGNRKQKQQILHPTASRRINQQLLLLRRLGLLRITRKYEDFDHLDDGDGGGFTTNSRGTTAHCVRRRIIRRLTRKEDKNHIILLVDLKASPKVSIPLLHEVLAPLRPHLTHIQTKTGTKKVGRITVLLSGNRPSDKSCLVHHDSGTRYMFLDGRAHDVHKNTDSTLVPMVSLNWKSLPLQFARIRGRGEAYIRELVEQAHSQGKTLRIFGSPNAEMAWSKMLRYDVDYLSIDNHGRFVKFASRMCSNQRRGDSSKNQQHPFRSDLH